MLVTIEKSVKSVKVAGITKSLSASQYQCFVYRTFAGDLSVLYIYNLTREAKGDDSWGYKKKGVTSNAVFRAILPRIVTPPLKLPKARLNSFYCFSYLSLVYFSGSRRIKIKIKGKTGKQLHEHFFFVSQ